MKTTFASSNDQNDLSKLVEKYKIFILPFTLKSKTHTRSSPTRAALLPQKPYPFLQLPSRNSPSPAPDAPENR